MKEAGPTRKSWKRRLVWGVVVVPVLAFALGVWQLQRLQHQASSRIAATLGETFGARASVGEVRLDLVHLRLVARDVTVRAGGRELFSAPEIAGRPAAAALLRGQLELRSLSLPAASMRLTAADVARLSHRSRGGLRGSLRIASLSLVLDLTARGHVEAHGAKLDVTTDATGGSAFALASERARWTSAEGEARASGRLDARGTWSAPNATQPAAEGGEGKLVLAQLHVGDQTFAEPVAIDWRQRAEAWTFVTRLKDGAHALDVKAELRGDHVGVALQPHAAPLERVLQLAGTGGVAAQGLVEGRLDLEGTVAPLALSGTYELAVSRLRVLARGNASPLLEVPQLRASGRVSIAASGAQLDSIQLAFGQSHLTGAASLWTLGGLDAAIRGDAVDLADLGSVWGSKLEGRGTLDATVQLGASPSTVTAQLALVDAAIGGKQLGHVDAKLALDPSSGRLTLEHADVNSPERQFVADGSVLDFTRSGLTEARAKLRSSRLPLRELYRVLGAADDPILAQLQGTAAGTAELALDANDSSSALTLSLALSLTNIDLSGYAFDRGRLAAKIALPDRVRGLAAGTLSLSQLSLGAASGTLELSGEMRSGKLDMKLGVHSLPLERAPWLRARSKSLLTGRIDGGGTLGGDAQSARADLKLSLEGLRLLGEPLGRIQLAALLRTGASADLSASTCRESRTAIASAAFHGASTWLFCGDGLDSHLHVDLALGNGAARPIRGRVALTGFSLGPFLRDLQPSAADPHGLGTLTAALELTGGGLAEPERLSGTLQVQKLALGAGQTRLESTAPFELRSRDGALELGAAALKGLTQAFVLSAAGTLGKGGKLVADGELEASVFAREAEPLVKVFGNAGVHLEWAPFAQPALRGKVELRDLALRGPGTISAKHLHGSLALSGDRLRLEGVEAEVGGGKLALAGQLQLEGLRPSAYDLSIEAQRVALEPEPLVQLVLDASTKLAWRGAAALPELSGTIAVRHLAYGKPLHLEALAAMNRARSGAPARDRLKLDLAVEQREPLRVRNMLLDGELVIAGADHKLRVVGTDQRLGVLGDLAVTRGRLSFQGNDFHFTRGEIALRDPSRISPRFAVRAVADQPRRADTSVVLSAQGTREAFDVAVTCDAGAAPVAAPPFKCSYARERMACDDFDRLVAQWTCPTKVGASASTRR